MIEGANAGIRHVDLPGVGLRIGDELGTVFAGKAAFTTSRTGAVCDSRTGAMSRMKVKLRLSYNVALVVADGLKSRSV